MRIFLTYMAVGAGGFLGAIARYFVSTVCAWMFGSGFPVGTLVINLTGSFFLGWFLTVVGQRMLISDITRMAVAVGFVGAYTTFSTFCFETVAQLQDGSGIKASVNIIGSVVLGIIAVYLGMLLGKHV